MNHGTSAAHENRETDRIQDTLILPYDDERLRAIAAKHRGETWFFSTRQEIQPGAWIDDHHIEVNVGGSRFTALSLDAHLPILEYPENLLVSILIAKYFEISEQQICESLKTLFYD